MKPKGPGIVAAPPYDLIKRHQVDEACEKQRLWVAHAARYQQNVVTPVCRCCAQVPHVGLIHAGGCVVTGRVMVSVHRRQAYFGKSHTPVLIPPPRIPP